MALKKSIEVKFRPSGPEKTEKTPLKGASRIFIRKDSLIELTGSVDNGKLCYVERVNTGSDGTVGVGPRREALLWFTPDPNLKKSVAQVSKAFQEAGGFNLTDTYRITPAESPAEDAREVVFEDITAGDSVTPIQDTWTAAWKATLKVELDVLDFVFPGMVLRDVTFARDKRNFLVRSVNGRPNSNCRVAPALTEVLISASANGSDEAERGPPPRLHVSGVPELHEQTKELNDFLFLHSKESLFQRWHGLVVHGGRGTGKTMLLEQIAGTGWGTVHRIKPTDKSSTVQDVFKSARAQQPSVVIIDELEALLDKDRANRSTVINALVEALDSVNADFKAKGERPRVVVVAASQDYVTDVPLKLREPGRLEQSILIPPLDIHRRESLISSYFGPVIHPKLRRTVAESLSLRAHAYNGGDLRRVMHVAERLIVNQLRASSTSNGTAPETDADGVDGTDPNETTALSEDPAFYSDILDSALLKVRPTAMQDVNLKPPPVYWNDISGQDSVKKDLRWAVDMLTLPRETVREYIGSPPKGFLLYGPPGCSKTMTAQAMATESGLNFLAVKGAELLNMYVGESERQVRSLFARARAAAPSMIFFDEIDSIAGSRKGFGEGAAAGGGGSHGGPNVLTTLLNEMDGFEDLRGVLVLAATNRPQALDPAIMRPGRFDEIVYVPPPDSDARQAILERHTAGRRLAHDVDFMRLATLSEGHSGAEVVSICRTAGKLAISRLLESRRTEWARVSAAADGDPILCGHEEEDEGIRMADFLDAMAGQRRMITKEMLQGYSVWEKQFH